MGSCKKFLKTYKAQRHIHTPLLGEIHSWCCIYSRALGPLCAKTLWDFNIYIKRIIIQKLTCSMRRCRCCGAKWILLFFSSAGGARGLGGGSGGANTHRAEAEIEFLHVFLFSVNAAKLFRLRCWLLLRSAANWANEKCKHTYTRTNRHRNGLFFCHCAFQINTNKRIKKIRMLAIVIVANSFATFYNIPKRASGWSLEKKTAGINLFSEPLSQ